MDPSDNLRRIRDLELERDELQQQLSRLEFILNTQRKGAQWIGGLGALLFMGPNLTLAIRNYLVENINEGTTSIETKTALASAIIRRIFYVGLIGLLAIILPALLLVWQNIELKEQTKVLVSQMEMERQAELTRTLFGTRQQRQEIAKTYIVEKLKSGIFDLTGVDLSSIDLTSVDMEGILLRKGNLIGTVFERAALDDADLSYSMSVDANYSNASMKNVNFHGSDLSMSAFVGANLENADFSNTRIFRVNFTNANLEGANFENSCFNGDQAEVDGETTSINPAPVWPNDFDPSKHKILDNCELYKQVYFE